MFPASFFHRFVTETEVLVHYWKALVPKTRDEKGFLVLTCNVSMRGSVYPNENKLLRQHPTGADRAAFVLRTLAPGGGHFRVFVLVPIPTPSVSHGTRDSITKGTVFDGPLRPFRRYVDIPLDAWLMMTYSMRSATEGCRRAARLAGKRQATAVTNRENPMMAARSWASMRKGTESMK